MSERLEVILNFHGVGAPSRSFDTGEAPYWIDSEFFREIVAHVAGRPDRERIGLTFDDGNISDVAVATPVLRDAGLVATFFLLAGRLNTPGFVDRAGVAALEAAGMTIGVHGWAHVDWRREDAAGRRREMVDARTALRAAARGPVDAAAIPFGAYDRSVLRDLRAAGYRAIYTSDGGRAGEGPVMSRTSVRADMTIDDVAAILDGREPLGRRLRRVAAIARKRLL